MIPGQLLKLPAAMAFIHVGFVGKPAAACRYRMALAAEGNSYTLAMASVAIGRCVMERSVLLLLDFVFGVGMAPLAK